MTRKGVIHYKLQTWGDSELLLPYLLFLWGPSVGLITVVRHMLFLCGEPRLSSLFLLLRRRRLIVVVVTRVLMFEESRLLSLWLM